EGEEAQGAVHEITCRRLPEGEGVRVQTRREGVGAEGAGGDSERGAEGAERDPGHNGDLRRELTGLGRSALPARDASSARGHPFREEPSPSRKRPTLRGRARLFLEAPGSSPKRPALPGRVRSFREKLSSSGKSRTFLHPGRWDKSLREKAAALKK